MDRDVIEQYHCAGLVAHKAMFHAEKLVRSLEDPHKIDELGPKVDSFIKIQVAKYLPNITAKGVARPTEFYAHLVRTVDNEPTMLVYKMALGVHFGGYSVIFSHSITPNALMEEDEVVADAITGSQVANEAVLSLLSTTLMGQQVNGTMIRYVVEQIAEEFDCFIAPTSYVCRQTRFNYSQPGVPNDDKFVAWNLMPIKDFRVEEDEAWLIDIAMTPKDGKLSFQDCLVQKKDLNARHFTVFSVNYTNPKPIPAGLSKQMAGIMQNCFPQRVSDFGGTAALYPCMAQNLLIPWVYPRVMRPCPRNASSVLLLGRKSSASGNCTLLRLSGGAQFPPRNIKSKRVVKDPTIAKLLQLRHSRNDELDYAEIFSA